MDVKRKTVESLVSVLKSSSSSEEEEKDAVCELRLLAKWGDDHRISIVEAGAVPYLLPHLYSSNAKLQENAITALLNLSIYTPNREVIMSSRGGLDAIVHCLTAGRSLEAKQNAAAAIFSLLLVESYRAIVGDRPEVIRGGTGIIEDATAVIAQVAGCGESEKAFKKILGIEVLVDLLDTGTPRVQENAASALLNLAQCGGEQVADEILDVQSAMPALSVLLTSGTARCKSKISSLLSLLLVHQRRPATAMF